MRRFDLALALMLAAAPAWTQEAATAPPDPKVPQGKNLEVPVGWTVRPDVEDPKLVVGKDASADIAFVNMTPGWHVTTGPAAILYHPASSARGAFRASAKIHLFDPKGRLEGYGLFFGGSELDSPNQSYGYFLVRNDGKFLIKKRRGEATEVVRDWTASDAVAVFAGGAPGSSVVNVLAVEARPADVSFSVNGKEVAVVPRSALPLDGVVGLRVNHHLNLHVSDLQVAKLPSAAAPR